MPIKGSDTGKVNGRKMYKDPLFTEAMRKKRRYEERQVKPVTTRNKMAKAQVKRDKRRAKLFNDLTINKYDPAE